MSSLLLKFGTLLTRTLAKPVANVIKAQVKEHPAFRKACISFAQTMHQLDLNMRMRILGEKNVKVRPLNDAKAIENGANFLSESFIFSVAGGLILFESNRQRKKEVQRRKDLDDDILALQDEIEWLKDNLKKQNLLMNEYHAKEDLKPTVLKNVNDSSKAAQLAADLNKSV